MLIYRIEHATNNHGPYIPTYRADDVCFELSSDLRRKHNGHPKHPGCRQEFMGRFREKEHFCGFGSIDALKRWFHGFLKKLSEAGYVIKIYDIDPSKVLVGKYQVVFEKRHAALVATQLILGRA